MMQFIKKYHSILPYVCSFVLAFLFFQSCERSKRYKAEQHVKEQMYTAKEKAFNDIIALKDGIIQNHRFKEQRYALKNQVIKAETKKLPTAKSFKKSLPELNTTPKKVLEKEFVALQEADSSREVLLNRATANNDSLITEVEKEHEVADSKDSTEIKRYLLCDSTVRAERERADKAEKRAKFNGKVALGSIILNFLQFLKDLGGSR
jgi:hypothetical protein